MDTQHKLDSLLGTLALELASHVDDGSCSFSMANPTPVCWIL